MIEVISVWRTVLMINNIHVTTIGYTCATNINNYPGNVLSDDSIIKQIFVRAICTRDKIIQ